MSKGKAAHLDFNPQVETRLVYDLKSGEFKPPLKKSQRFISSIPLPWLSQAVRLPFSAVRVGLACWFMDGCNRQAPFKLSRATCQLFNVTKWDKRRGLRQLETAGLIEVLRQPGQSSLIAMVREPAALNEDNNV